MSNSSNSNMVAVHASRSFLLSINQNSHHGYGLNDYRLQGSPPDLSEPLQIVIQDFREYSAGIARNINLQRNNGFTHGDPSVLDRFKYTRSVSKHFEAGNRQE